MPNMTRQGDIELEKASSRNQFPEKCLKCAKSSKPLIHDGCSFCQDLRFQEEVFCDLNRSAQNPHVFECHAFQPLLKLITSSGQKNPPEVTIQSLEIAFKKRLNSDKVKYQRALALQKLSRNPEEVMLNIKYHFAWNVVSRIPVFRNSESAIDLIDHTITACSEAVGGFACLLWLAPDHLHVYVESDGGVPADSMAHTIRKKSEISILERFPGIISSSKVEKRVWDEAYFVETLG